MVFLPQTSEKTAKSFVMCLLQPLAKLMIGGTHHLRLGQILFMMDDLLQLLWKRMASEDPFEELLFKVWLIKFFRGMLWDSLEHVLQVLKNARIPAMCG